MAYCRQGEDSDVYMYPKENHIVCCGCTLNGADGTEFIFRRDVIRHLRMHQSWGHKVPGYAFRFLAEEIRELGDEVKAGVSLHSCRLIQWITIARLNSEYDDSHLGIQSDDDE